MFVFVFIILSRQDKKERQSIFSENTFRPFVLALTLVFPPAARINDLRRQGGGGSFCGPHETRSEARKEIGDSSVGNQRGNKDDTRLNYIRR